MNTVSAINKSLSISRIHQIVQQYAAVVFCAAFLAAPVSSTGAELKTETLSTWDAYVQAVDSRMASRQTQFLWVDEASNNRQRVQNGETLNTLPVV